MNRSPSFPRPDASPIIATQVETQSYGRIPPQAPPVVAPPIVRSAHVQRAHSEDPATMQAEPTHGDRWPFLSRGLRDVMIAGVCLVAGIVAAQNRALPINQTHTFALADETRLQATETVPISAVAEVPPAPAIALKARSLTDAGVHGSVSETIVSVPPVDKAIKQSDGVLQVATQVDIASRAESPANHSLISQRSTNQQQRLEKVNPAAALQAIVAAQVALKSLPAMEPQSTIIPGPQCQDGTCRESKRSLDTVLSWANTPADAYRLAGESEKLVFLIHVSGNFEIPGFT